MSILFYLGDFLFLEVVGMTFLPPPPYQTETSNFRETIYFRGIAPIQFSISLKFYLKWALDESAGGHLGFWSLTSNVLNTNVQVVSGRVIQSSKGPHSYFRIIFSWWCLQRISCPPTWCAKHLKMFSSRNILVHLAAVVAYLDINKWVLNIIMTAHLL